MYSQEHSILWFIDINIDSRCMRNLEHWLKNEYVNMPILVVDDWSHLQEYLLHGGV